MFKKSRNKRMNILLLPKWYPNKMDPFDGNFVENHAHAISLYHEVFVLFVHSDESSSKLYVIENQKNKNLIEIRCYFKKSKLFVLHKLINAFRYFKAQKKAYRYLIQEYHVSIDVAHIHVLSRTAPFALWLKHKQNIPYGITEHWSGFLKESGEYKGLVKSKLTKKAAKQAEFITTVSPYLRDAMKSHGLSNQYSIIPNVVDCTIFKPAEKFPRKKVNILFVGNLLQSPKRILDILDIFASIRDKRQDFKLDIYGEGKDESLCIEKIKKHQLEKYVQLKGTRTREEIAEIMAKADFLFLFSEFENQPCVINESQACGLPVVVPDIPGIKAFMQDELGLIFPRLNHSAFESALLQMMDNYSRYNRHNIRDYALKNFSEDVIGKQFDVVYKKVDLF